MAQITTLTKPAVTNVMSIPSPEFITTTEAAQALMVRVPTIHVYIRRGIIPAFKFGDVVRIPKVEFYNWLESTRVVPNAELQSGSPAEEK
jgi:excisionase family DNA binding protein